MHNEPTHFAQQSLPSTVARVTSGLGNQLFIFASSLGLAQNWNRQLILSDKWFSGKQRGRRLQGYRRSYLLNTFPRIRDGFEVVSQFPTVPDQLLHRNLRLSNSLTRGLYIEQKPGFDETLWETPMARLMGYFQDPKYFAHLRHDLLQYFSLEVALERQLQAKLLAYRKSGRRLVAIHVRREDTLVKGNEWAGLLSSKYYETAMGLVKDRSVQFLVFSDSLEWCQNQEVFHEATLIDETNPVHALRLMSYCDDFIIAGSTLSWWGAWLSRTPDKRVIAPTPFFRFSSETKWSHLLLPNWQLLSADWETD